MKVFLNRIAKTIKRYPELISIPVIILLWIVSIPVLRFADPTSGVFDPGIFQIPLFAIFQLFLYLSVAWLIMRFLFGTAHKFLLNNLKSNFQNLSTWEKVKWAYLLFCFLVFCLVLLSHTLQ